MVKFSDGMRWTVYGNGGFSDKSSLTLDDENGNQLTGVVRANPDDYLALSAQTGALLTGAVDFESAVKAAEKEALNPSYSTQ